MSEATHRGTPYTAHVTAYRQRHHPAGQKQSRRQPKQWFTRDNVKRVYTLRFHICTRACTHKSNREQELDG